MPWQECSQVDERLRFVARLLKGEHPRWGAQAAPAPSSVDAMMMTRTTAAIRAKAGSRWKRNHVTIVATRSVGRTISRTIPVETRCCASERALARNTGNTIPDAMSPHDAQVPKPSSCARRLFKRSGASAVEIVTLTTSHGRQPPRGPSGPPRQIGQPRRRGEAWLARRTPAGARPEGRRQLNPGRPDRRYRGRSRLL